MPGDPFYKTKQWRQLKMRVLANWRAAGKNCAYCGGTLDWSRRYSVIVDHKIPRKKRPDLALTESNLVVVHHPCNSKKAAWDENENKPQIGADGFPVGSGWSKP